MLDRIKNLARNAIKLDSGKIFKEVMGDPAVKEFVATLQQNQMYDFGVDAKGVTLGDYSEVSVTKFGKTPGHIKMYDTGAFFKGIKVRTTSEEIIISADTIKQAWDGAVNLLDRWPDLLGLNDESLSKLHTYIKPLFIQRVRASLFA